MRPFPLGRCVLKFLLVMLLTPLMVAQSASHIKYEPQHYKFASKGMMAEDGKQYPTLEPYVAFALGVVQIEGPKHKDKDMVTCVPESLQDEQGMHIELKCDDGSRFGVAAVSFPAKGQQ